MVLRAQVEPHIEIHKYSLPSVFGVAIASVVLQAFLPLYIGRAVLLELPLLVTLYFGLSRRNPSTGLFLGMVVGLLQDIVSGRPVGLYGIAKTLVGFTASSIGSRLDVEHPLSRFALAFAFFHFHHAAFAVTKRVLLAEPESFFSAPLLAASLVNAALAIGLFPLLDRLRKPS